MNGDCFGQLSCSSYLSSNFYQNIEIGSLTFSNYKSLLSDESIYPLNYSIRPYKYFFATDDAYNKFNGRQELNFNLLTSTEVRYHLASKASQRLQLCHNQILSSNSYLDLMTDFVSTKGYYPNQKMNLKYFRPEIEKSFLKNLYTIKIGYEIFSMSKAENGGLKDVNAFITNRTNDERTIAVRMNNSFSEAISHSMLIFQEVMIPNSSSDSIDKISKFSWKNLTKYNRSTRKFFTDRIYSELFSNTFFDTSSTHDSIFKNELVNHSTMEYYLNPILNCKADAQEVYLILDANFQLKEARLNSKQTPVFRSIQLHPGLALRTKKLSSRAYLISSFYTKPGQGIGVGADGEIRFESSVYAFSLATKDSIPPLFYFHTYSNHFVWEKNFTSIRHYSAELDYQKFWKKWQISAAVNFHHWKNHHFLNSMSEPEVYPESLFSSETFVRIQYFFNKWKLISESHIQNSNRRHIVRQPEFIQNLQVFICDSVFKSKALLQTGPYVRYVSGYILPSFNPALQEFYNGQEIKTKGFYQLSFSAQLKIKEAEIYFVLEHLNAGWNSRNYFYAVDYPLPGRIIKFGIKWLLND